MADLLCDRERYAESVFHYQQAISLNPKLAAAHNNLAIALKLQRRYEEAREVQQQALALKPDSLRFRTNLASILQSEGKLEEAVAACQQVIAEADPHAIHHYNLACVQRDLGRLEEAIANNRRALELDSQFAEAHWNQAVCYLLNGEFDAGWREFQWRRQVPFQYQYPHHHSHPLWEGDRFSDRLYLHCEQGLGDAIQFLRYVPQVKARGGQVLLGVWQPLVELLVDFPGIDVLIGLSWHTAPDLDFDLQCSLLDLPAIFGTRVDTIPSEGPYLRASAARIEKLRPHVTGSGLKVGFAWKGSPRHANDDRRSTQLKTFEALATMEGISLYSLQTDLNDIRIGEDMKAMNIVDLSEHLTSLADTAAAIAHLDLVITVDTALLHLAGALGKRTWGLLPYSPDWRWMLKREDSPWYPSVRLFRQSAPGDWQGVMERVVTDLRQERGIADGHA